MIREANTGDISSITGLWEEMMNFHIQKSSIYEIKPDAQQIYEFYLKKILKSHESIVLVYEIKNKIVGYLMAEESLLPPVYKEENVGTVVEICITEKHRNKRIGEELLVEVEKWFISRDITTIECVISDFNEISKSFWFKNKYKPYNLICFKKLS
ncbi:N-acetyltransferase family protein [Methanobacterium sp.]|uniref:GNAT family N-acetyltransferase n=1 Tax=Methanobacterium sp. TaxID=2164 RepID=UPI003C710B2E